MRVMQKALNFVNYANQGLQHSEDPGHHSSDNSSQQLTYQGKRKHGTSHLTNLQVRTM